MSSRIGASLVVWGADVDFAGCTQAAGIEPTRTFVRAFEYDSSLVPPRQWCVALEKRELDSVDVAVNLLLNRFPSLSSIAAYARLKNHAILVTCSIDIYEDRPLYELSKETIESLFRLGAGFSMDIHDYCER